MDGSGMPTDSGSTLLDIRTQAAFISTWHEAKDIPTGDLSHLWLQEVFNGSGLAKIPGRQKMI